MAFLDMRFILPRDHGKQSATHHGSFYRNRSGGGGVGRRLHVSYFALVDELNKIGANKSPPTARPTLRAIVEMVGFEIHLLILRKKITSHNAMIRIQVICL
jgi:hypothetical protein